MSQQPVPAQPGDRPWYVLGPEDPPMDFSREEAAYAPHAERLARDHLGKIALVHEDELIGVFDDPDEAFAEAHRRFGEVKVMVRVIRDPKAPPDFVPLANPYHPCCRIVEDRRKTGTDGEIHG